MNTSPMIHKLLENRGIVSPISCIFEFEFSANKIINKSIKLSYKICLCFIQDDQGLSTNKICIGIYENSVCVCVKSSNLVNVS